MQKLFLIETTNKSTLLLIILNLILMQGSVNVCEVIGDTAIPAGGRVYFEMRIDQVPDGKVRWRSLKKRAFVSNL